MIQALKNITGKEAVYSGRGSLNGHQIRQLRTNVKYIVRNPKELLAEILLCKSCRLIEWSRW